MSINGSDNTSGNAWSNNPDWSAQGNSGGGYGEPYGSASYGAPADGSYAQPGAQGYPYGGGYDASSPHGSAYQQAPGAQGYGEYPGGYVPGYDGFGEPRPGQGTLNPDDERTFAIIAHLSGIAGMIVSAGWLGFVGPLVVWALYKDRSPYVREAAARSFNFYLAMTVASIIAWVCLFTVILIPLTIVIFVVAGLMSIICPILAAISASRYELGRYPVQFRVLR